MRNALLGLVFGVILGAVPVSAAAPPNAVTISLSRPVVVFGGTVKLSGAVANHKSGEQVTILDEPFGQSSFADLATVATVAGGKWSYVADPTIRTSYEARWKEATSQSVTVNVRPKISLQLVSLANRTLSTEVTAARSFQGKFVLVQRMTSTGTLRLKKLILDAGSSATFHVRLHPGRNRLRVVMPSSQTSPGYITGFSKVLTVRR